MTTMVTLTMAMIKMMMTFHIFNDNNYDNDEENDNFRSTAFTSWKAGQPKESSREVQDCVRTDSVGRCHCFDWDGDEDGDDEEDEES